MVINGHVEGRSCAWAAISPWDRCRGRRRGRCRGGEMKKDPSAILHSQVQQVRLPVIRPSCLGQVRAVEGPVAFLTPAPPGRLVAAAFLGFYVLLALSSLAGW